MSAAQVDLGVDVVVAAGLVLVVEVDQCAVDMEQRDHRVIGIDRQRVDFAGKLEDVVARLGGSSCVRDIATNP